MLRNSRDRFESADDPAKKPERIDTAVTIKHAITEYLADVTSPFISSIDNWSFSVFDPTRLSKPEAIGDFGLHGSVRPVLAGRFAVTAVQVSASSNGVEWLLFRLWI